MPPISVVGKTITSSCASQPWLVARTNPASPSINCKSHFVYRDLRLWKVETASTSRISTTWSVVEAWQARKLCSCGAKEHNKPLQPIAR
jgi:hypothetical protein